MICQWKLHRQGQQDLARVMLIMRRYTCVVIWEVSVPEFLFSKSCNVKVAHNDKIKYIIKNHSSCMYNAKSKGT